MNVQGRPPVVLRPGKHPQVLDDRPDAPGGLLCIANRFLELKESGAQIANERGLVPLESTFPTSAARQDKSSQVRAEICRFPATTDSGLLISCATPAARVPIDAIRSEMSNCSCIARRSARTAASRISFNGCDQALELSFQQEVVNTAAHRLDGDLFAHRPGHDDEWNVQVDAPNDRERLGRAEFGQ